MDSEREILSHIDGSNTTSPTAPAPDENGSSAANAAMVEAPVPASVSDKPPPKLTPTGVGGPAIAATSGDGKRAWARVALPRSTATVGGEIGKDRSERANGEAPPWKGFTLNEGKFVCVTRWYCHVVSRSTCKQEKGHDAAGLQVYS